MISFKNVNFAYGNTKVLNNFNFSVKNGEKICLLGKSGLGKTTVLRLIAGLESTAGVKINGTVSYVFQEDRLLNTTVLKNVTLACNNEQKATEVLTAFGLGTCLNKSINSLSGGMKRRVAIARAVCYNANIYLFDEPFNGIDYANAEIISNYINTALAEKTVIIVSHNKQDAALLNAKITKL